MAEYQRNADGTKYTTFNDGSITIYGAGWFWAKFDTQGNVIETAPGMRARPARHQFIKSARRKWERIMDGHDRAATEECTVSLE